MHSDFHSQCVSCFADLLDRIIFHSNQVRQGFQRNQMHQLDLKAIATRTCSAIVEGRRC